MNSNLEFLQQRNSAPKLTSPGPSEHELAEMFQAAVRAPDHAWLRPWRFLTIEGERRNAFGELLCDALVKRKPETDEAARIKVRSSPLRAPLLIVSIVKFKEHPKVPRSEQRLSAGCAAHALLLAAEALGYAGVWRTGDSAFDPVVMQGLGLASDEEIIGFLYVGTREGKAKPLPAIDAQSLVSAY
ncbi:MAG: nitroreductase family protein [Halioglobus sp.]